MSTPETFFILFVSIVYFLYSFAAWMKNDWKY